MPTPQAAAALTVAISPSGWAMHCCATGAMRTGHDSVRPAAQTHTQQALQQAEPSCQAPPRSLQVMSILLTSTMHLQEGCLVPLV